PKSTLPRRKPRFCSSWILRILPGIARHMPQPQFSNRPVGTAWPSAIPPLLAGTWFCESDSGVTKLDLAPDNHQRFGGSGACRRQQLMPRSISKRAMLSTAAEEALSTELLMPLPKSHDSGTTPTMISSDGVSPDSRKCERDS